MNATRHFSTISMLLLLIFCITSLGAVKAMTAQPVTIEGQLELAIADFPGSEQHEDVAFIRDTTTGERYRVNGDVSFIQPGSIVRAQLNNNQAINVQQSPGLAQSKVSSYPATGNERWVSLICETTTSNPVTRDFSYFDEMYPILSDYLNRTSYGVLTIEGYTAGKFKVDYPSTYYTGGEYGWDRGSYTLADHCYAEAKRQGVNFADITGIQFLLNDLGGQASLGGLYCPKDEPCYRATWLVSWSYQNLHVDAHELLHSYGLPHSTGANRSPSGNPFDVMSDTWTCMVPHPVYNCLPQYTIGYFRHAIKWLPDERVQQIWDTGIHTVTLDLVSEPHTGDKPLMVIVNVPFDMETKIYGYTIENRGRVGVYDAGLPESGIVVGQIKSSFDRWNLLQNRAGVKALNPGQGLNTGTMEVCVQQANPDGTMDITIAVGTRCMTEVNLPLLRR